MISLFPRAKPILAPARPYVFDSELSSIPTSLAPGYDKKLLPGVSNNSSL